MVLLGPLTLGLVLAGPAAADTPASWPDPPPMSKLEALLIFAGIPLAVLVIIALLVMAPSVARGPRYRPGLSWWADPEWFNGPPAVEVADRLALEPGHGHASGATAVSTAPSQPAGATAASQVVMSDATLEEGGASARW